MKKFLTVPNACRVIAIFSMFISIIFLVDFPEEYGMYLLIICVFVVQQLTHNYTVLKRLNDMFYVFRIFILFFSIDIIYETEFQASIYLYIVIFIINVLTLVIPEFKVSEDWNKRG